MYDTCEMYLEGNDWIAGDTMTIADFHYISSIASAKVRSYKLLCLQLTLLIIYFTY